MFVCGRGVSKDCRQKKYKVEAYQEKVTYICLRENSKASRASQRQDERRINAPPLTVPPAFADGNQGGKALKWLPAHSNFERKTVCFSGSVVTTSGHFVHKTERWTGTGVFIYALSADETSPALAAPRHAITALFSCRFKRLCPPRRQRHFHGNADRAYNTLHFASKVVCQGASPFGNPGQQNRLNISHFPCA